MKKFTTASDAGAARARSYSMSEPMDEQPSPADGMKVDPSVRIGPLRGEQRGSVPMNVTIGKPQAYQAKKGTP